MEPKDTTTTNAVANLFKILGHPLRLKAVFLLHEAGEMSAGDLSKNLGSEQTLTSHHLGDMRRAGILGTRRSGKTINYFLIFKDLPSQIIETAACVGLFLPD